MIKKKKLTKIQLEQLFECWKSGNNTKEWLDLISKNLPKVQPLLALSIMRKMARTDERWLRIATRKKNKKEKEKQEKLIEKEKRKVAATQKKQEREKRLVEKNKVREYANRIKNIKQNLKLNDIENVSNKIKLEYFFCSDINQYINNISCIFRLFSDEYDILLDPICEKCKKMDKYISLLEEITDARSKKTRRCRTSESGSKNKEKKSATTKRAKDGPSDS